MNIGLIDVDSHNFPNFALMRVSAYYKAIGGGNLVEWATPFTHYDKVVASKIFTFTEDFNYYTLQADCIEKGGTGYDIHSRLPDEIENSLLMDYSIYPKVNFSVQFFSRGCIRKCPFCLVRDKEGYIHPVSPVELNPKGEWIEVLDNNFFANTEWHSAVDYLIKAKQPVNLHGVDVRIMDEEQAFWLNKLRLKNNIHIAWDNPKVDLTENIRSMIKHIKPSKITCYVLVGYNSTIEEDLYRINTLRSFGILSYVAPFRDYTNSRKPSQYEKDLARWANNRFIFKSCKFEDFEPRKGFKCKEYFK